MPLDQFFIRFDDVFPCGSSPVRTLRARTISRTTRLSLSYVQPLRPLLEVYNSGALRANFSVALEWLIRIILSCSPHAHQSSTY